MIADLISKDEDLTEDEALQLYNEVPNLSAVDAPRAKMQLRRYRTVRQQNQEPLWPRREAEARQKEIPALENLWLGDTVDSTPEGRMTRQFALMSHVTRKPALSLVDAPGAWRRATARALNLPEGAGNSEEVFDKEAKKLLTRRRDLRWLTTGTGKEETDEKRRAVNDAAMNRWAFRAGLAGVPMAEAFSQWQEQARSRAEWHAGDGVDLLPTFQKIYAAADERASPHRVALKLAFDHLIEGMSQHEGSGGTPAIDAAELLAFPFGDTAEERIKAPPRMTVEEFRAVGIPVIRAFLELQGGAGDKGTGTKFAESMTRPFMNALGAGGDKLEAMQDTVLGWLGLTGPEDEDSTSAEQRSARRGITTLLRSIADNEIDPIKPAMQTWFQGKGLLEVNPEQVLYDFGGSAGYVTTVAIPGAGIPMSLAAYQDQNKAQLMLANPDLSEGDASLAATLAAPIQAALDRLSLSVVTGKLPILSGLLNRVATPGGSKTLRWSLYTAGALATEYVAEKGQDAAPLLMQDALAAVKADVPNADWRGFELFDARTFWAVLPLALLGGGVNTFRDQKAAAEAVNDSARLKAMGFSDEQIAKIQAPGSIDGKIAVLQSTFKDRTPPKKDAGDWRQGVKVIAERTAAAEQQVEQIREAGISIRSTEGPEGTVWTVRDTTGVETQHTDAASAVTLARSKMIDAEIQKDDEYFEAVTGYLETAKPGTTFETRGDSGSLQSVLDSAETTGDQKSIDAVWRRVEQERVAASDPNLQPADFTVLGQSITEFKEGVYTATARVFDGGGVLDLVEEKSEGDFHRFIREKRTTHAQMGALIREVEQATGDTYLPNFDDANPESDASKLAVLEGYSSLVRAYALAVRKEGGKVGAAARKSVARQAKSERRRLVEAEKQGVAGKLFDALRQYFAWTKAVIQQAARLRKAKGEGKLENVEQFLRESVGLSEEAQHAEGVAKEAADMWEEAGITDDGSVAEAPADDDGMAFSLRRDRSAQDAEYMRAVESGDMETAQRMVDAAAKAAGYNVGPVWHETGAKFDEFKHRSHRFGFFFAFGPRMAKKAASRKGVTVRAFLKSANPYNSPKDTSLPAWIDLEPDVDWHGNKKPGLSEAINAGGFDSVYVRDEAGVSVAVANPEQVKSADPVTRDAGGNVIPLSRRFDSSKASISFSLAPAARIAQIEQQLGRALNRDPEAKRRTFIAARDRLQRLAHDWSNVRHTWKGDKIEPVVDPRSKASLDKEQAFREADAFNRIFEAAENDVQARYHTILSQPDLATLRSHPVLDYLLTQGNTRKGGLPQGPILSRKRAVAAGIYDSKKGDYDEADGLPQWLFQGSRTPDKVASDLFNNHPGILKGDTASDLYAEVRKALNSVAGMRESLKKATNELRDARVAAKEQARKEADAWRQQAEMEQARDHNPRDSMIRDLRTLDAALAVLPPEVKAKVGGYIAVAGLKTDKARLEEIRRRIDSIGEHLETHLQKENVEALDKLIDKAAPDREGGKKPRGKIGPEAHRYFDRVAEARSLSEADIAGKKKTIADLLADPATTPELAADLFEQEQILDQFGSFEKQDSAAQEKALQAAINVYETGRNEWKEKEAARLAEVQAMVQGILDTLGRATDAQITAAKRKAAGKVEITKNGALDLKSFAEVLDAMLGRDHPLAQRWSQAVREGFFQKGDELRALNRRWRDAIKAAFPRLSFLKARRAVWEYGQDAAVTVVKREGGSTEVIPVPVPKAQAMVDGAIDYLSLGFTRAEVVEMEAALKTNEALPPRNRRDNVDIRRVTPGTPTETKLDTADAIAHSMLWAQKQYQEALSAHGWDQEAIDAINDQLPDPAKALRAHLAAEYAEGYHPLASLFRNMFGVDLPQIANYAPGTFYSMGTDGGATDPLNALTDSGGFRAGFLKDRKQHKARPRFENAFSLFFGHAAQTAHWKALAQITRELRGVFGNPEVKASIEARHGKNMLGAVNTWIEAIEGNGLKVQQGMFDRAVRALTSVQVYIRLAWNLGTILKQSSAALGSAYEIPARAYLRGLGKLMTGQLPVKRIWESDLIRRRMENGYSPEVRMVLGDAFTAPPSLRRDFLEKGLELIGGADAVFTTASAAIAHDHFFREGKAAGMTDEAAQALAWTRTGEVVDRTAQPADVGSRSLFELRQGALGKLLFLFATEARQKSSMWLTAWGHTLTGKATARDYRVLAISHLIVGPMIQAISAAWLDARDDDDEELFDPDHWNPMEFVWASVFGPLNGIPLAGAIYDAVRGFPDKSDNPLTNQVTALMSAKDLGAAVIDQDIPEAGDKEPWEWTTRKIVKMMQGMDAFTGTAGSVMDTAFRLGDDVIDTADEDKKQKAAVKAREKRERKDEKPKKKDASSW